MNPTPVNLPSDVVEAIAKLKFTEILELERIGIEKAPTLNFGDSFVVATENDLTLRVTVDQLMQYLNENLRNFIMWKPVVTNKSLVWERSNDDTQPMPLDWADILFPIVSETENGMMTTDLYKKLRAIDAENIVYKNALDTAIATRAPKEHTHEQYLLAANLPKKVSAFDNDAKYITLEGVPKQLSHYTNDVKYVRLEDIPLVGVDNSGLMTSDLFNSINVMLDTFTNAEQFQDMVNDIQETIRGLKLSNFDNDMDFISGKDLHARFAPLGAVNLVINSDFRTCSYPDREVASWTSDTCTIKNYIPEDGNMSSGIITMPAGGSFTGYLEESIGAYATITFNAKLYTEDVGQTTASMSVTLANVTNNFDITKDVWKRFEFLVDYDYTSNGSTITFTNTSGSNIELYISGIKVENGKLSSVYSPSYWDILNAHKQPATKDTLGSVRPDGVTTTIDEGGYLTVIKNSETGAAFIDDTKPSYVSVYSSAFMEEFMVNQFAMTDENGVIYTKHLPSFVDDIVEGEMTVDSEGNFVFVSDTAIFTEPSRGKIYLDTATNASYRWSGSEYIRCSTDMLGGEVLVKYDKTDKYMYFVFPEE